MTTVVADTELDIDTVNFYTEDLNLIGNTVTYRTRFKIDFHEEDSSWYTFTIKVRNNMISPSWFKLPS